MLTQEEFLRMLDELSGEIPQEFFKELNGGIVLRPEAKPHPRSKNGDLWILGEYCTRRNLGRSIKIYYGSYMHVYGDLEEEALRKRLRHTLRHEFRHHLEALAGERDLEIEDALRLAQYDAICASRDAWKNRLK